MSAFTFSRNSRQPESETPPPTEVIQPSEGALANTKQPIVTNVGEREVIPSFEPVTLTKETPTAIEEPIEKPLEQEKPASESSASKGNPKEAGTWAALANEVQ